MKDAVIFRNWWMLLKYDQMEMERLLRKQVIAAVDTLLFYRALHGHN